MNSLLFDTSFIIALEVADDENHETALRNWQNLLESLPSLTTTSYIFDEIASFFNSHNQHAKAVEIGSRLMNSPSIQFIHVDEELFNEAWKYFKQQKDKSYSLTNCISFVIMKRLKIDTALTFDRYFVQAGFKTIPEIKL